MNKLINDIEIKLTNFENMKFLEKINVIDNKLTKNDNNINNIKNQIDQLNTEYLKESNKLIIFRIEISISNRKFKFITNTQN